MIYLTIDMPTHCALCPLEVRGRCKAKKERPTTARRPEWCPLRECDETTLQRLPGQGPGMS